MCLRGQELKIMFNDSSIMIAQMIAVLFRFGHHPDNFKAMISMLF